ncbi:MAG: hypothetical protein A2513_03565 [Sulfurimonas sp. RIFOXYD12_FULL_33_39]|uniref:TolC family protein n=1 Tax=unclassified Sulfurimonas TaxID=2623549 RepID=UPI0008AD6385|nr:MULTISPECIES: TolC family protein [unclassified Sulfurimonas]OHE09218.1 MAG: hypothetical protein A2513_03565 [Sulfurimonas sp. RIFOXYD12_FULL_33_39]OHE12999.1 MAG: hypothetical protein A2530_05240 [Sulfurimonas sp. RIFOXYD2_FULL_34_21]DAB28431.1 MAG TPA: hypothetical protein CFH78_02465 [Sulfurimonas sp. UBA10385]
MKSIFFLFTCTLFLHAAEVNLSEILQKIEDEHPMAKSIKAYESAYASQNRAISSREALLLSTQGTYAKPDLGKSGYEYGVGVEQNIINPRIKESMVKSVSDMNDAQILELKQNFLLLKNEISFLYHVSCLDVENLNQYKKSLVAFETLYEKKAKAYDYKEISKKELLQLQIELKRLKNEYKRYESELKISAQSLESKTLLPFFGDKELSCKDLNSIVKEVTFNISEDSLHEQSLNKKIDSLESDFKRYDTLFDSLKLSASYQNEIDTNRFTLGVSIPLNFTTSFNEHSRAETLHKKSAIEYEKEEFKLEKASKIKLLQKELNKSFEDIATLKSMLNEYENALMPLVESAYRLGENSPIEYLLSQREVSNLKKELTEYYKNYYKTLFELYGVVKIKD